MENDNEDLINNLCSMDFMLDADPVVCRIRLLLERQWDIELRHVRRESNHIADRLVNLASMEANCSYEQPPVEVMNLLTLDWKQNHQD